MTLLLDSYFESFSRSKHPLLFQSVPQKSKKRRYRKVTSADFDEKSGIKKKNSPHKTNLKIIQALNKYAKKNKCNVYTKKTN